METLGIGVVSTPKGELELGLRRGWVQHLKLALSGAGGAAVVLAAFELLQREPQAGFGLLTSWGPWPIVILVIVIGVFGPFLRRINDTIGSSFEAVVVGVRQGAEAHTKTAEALTKLADQGTRQVLEVERLATFSAQSVPIMLERLDLQDEKLEQHTNTLAEILSELRSRGNEKRN